MKSKYLKRIISFAIFIVMLLGMLSGITVINAAKTPAKTQMFQYEFSTNDQLNNFSLEGAPSTGFSIVDGSLQYTVAEANLVSKELKADITGYVSQYTSGSMFGVSFDMSCTESLFPVGELRKVDVYFEISRTGQLLEKQYVGTDAVMLDGTMYTFSMASSLNFKSGDSIYLCIEHLAKGTYGFDNISMWNYCSPPSTVDKNMLLENNFTNTAETGNYKAFDLNTTPGYTTNTIELSANNGRLNLDTCGGTYGDQTTGNGISLDVSSLVKQGKSGKLVGVSAKLSSSLSEGPAFNAAVKFRVASGSELTYRYVDTNFSYKAIASGENGVTWTEISAEAPLFFNDSDTIYLCIVYTPLSGVYGFDDIKLWNYNAPVQAGTVSTVKRTVFNHGMATNDLVQYVSNGYVNRVIGYDSERQVAFDSVTKSMKYTATASDVANSGLKYDITEIVKCLPEGTTFGISVDLKTLGGVQTGYVGFLYGTSTSYTTSSAGGSINAGGFTTIKYEAIVKGYNDKVYLCVFSNEPAVYLKNVELYYYGSVLNKAILNHTMESSAAYNAVVSGYINRVSNLDSSRQVAYDSTTQSMQYTVSGKYNSSGFKYDMTSLVSKYPRGTEFTVSTDIKTPLTEAYIGLLYDANESESQGTKFSVIANSFTNINTKVVFQGYSSKVYLFILSKTPTVYVRNIKLTISVPIEKTMLLNHPMASSADVSANESGYVSRVPEYEIDTSRVYDSGTNSMKFTVNGKYGSSGLKYDITNLVEQLSENTSITISADVKSSAEATIGYLYDSGTAVSGGQKYTTSSSDFTTVTYSTVLGNYDNKVYFYIYTGQPTIYVKNIKVYNNREVNTLEIANFISQNGTTTMKINAKGDLGGVVIVAMYNYDNQCIGVQIKKAESSFDVTFNKECTYAKAFWWESISEMRPVTLPAATLK